MPYNKEKKAEADKLRAADHLINGKCRICTRPRGRGGILAYCDYHHALIKWHHRTKSTGAGPRPMPGDFQ